MIRHTNLALTMKLSTTEVTQSRARRMFVTSVSPVVFGLIFLGLAASASAQPPAAPAAERPAVGPARRFQLAPRVERTLANGLRVIVTHQAVVPKVTVTLTVRSGY